MRRSGVRSPSAPPNSSIAQSKTAAERPRLEETPSRGGQSVALALHALAQQLAVAAHRLRLFAGPPLRGLLVTAPQLHFPEHPFALHLFLQCPEGLVDVVVANEDLHGRFSPS